MACRLLFHLGISLIGGHEFCLNPFVPMQMNFLSCDKLWLAHPLLLFREQGCTSARLPPQPAVGDSEIECRRRREKCAVRGSATSLSPAVSVSPLEVHRSCSLHQAEARLKQS